MQESFSIEKDFNQKWSYWLIAKNVSDFTLQKFQEVLESNVIEVLTIASMLKEQVSVISNNNGSLTN